MSGVAATSSVSSVGATSVLTSGKPTATQPSLLPQATTAGLDPMGVLYLMQAESGNLETKQAKDNVVQKQAVKHEALLEEMKQAREAAEASQHHSFWDDVGKVCLTVGKVAACVASVAVAVVSCGAGTAVAVLAITACVMSSAAVVEGETHVLEKCGVSSDVAGGITLGLSIGGAVLSLGAGTLASGAEAGSEAVSTTTTVAKTAGKVASVTAAGADVAGGAARIESAHYEAEAADRDADARAAQMHEKLMQRVIDDVLATLSDDTKATQRRLGEVKDAMQSQDAAIAAAVMMTRST